MYTKRILLHTHALAAGGAERQLSLLARGLVSRGWEVHIVTLYQGGHFWDELKRDDIGTLHSLDRKGNLDFGVIKKLVQYIRRHNIDLVQSWMPVCNLFSYLAAKWTGITIITGVRASKMNYALGGKLYVAADKYIASAFSNATIFNSNAGLLYYLGGEKQTPTKCIIPNGLQLPLNKHFSKPLENKVVALGMIARLDPMKNHLMAFNALKQLISEDRDYELHLYGDGTSEWKNHLHKKAKELGITQYIRWHGFTRDIWSAFSNIDIFISSSLSEGMANTVLEAMAAGRPIVATDVGDTRLLIGNKNERGILIPSDNVDKLTVSIKKVVYDAARSINMGLNAQGFVMENYSVDAMVNSYEHLYLQQILGS